jgi:hypothetical protein
LLGIHALRHGASRKPVLLAPDEPQSAAARFALRQMARNPAAPVLTGFPIAKSN